MPLPVLKSLGIGSDFFKIQGDFSDLLNKIVILGFYKIQLWFLKKNQ